MLGIEIGNFHIKLGYGDKKNKLLIKKILEYTPQNCIFNGAITNVNILSDVIKEIIKKNNVKCKDICFTIYSTDNIVREIKLPLMKDDEIKNALSYEIEQYIPDPHNYVIDYKYLGTAFDDEKSVRVMIAAAPRKIIEGYVKLSDFLKLRLEAIDVYSNSLYKAIKKTNVSKDTTAIIDIGAELTNITIVDKGIYIFSRTMPFGGNELTQIIANTFNIDFKTAEEYKMTKKLLIAEQGEYYGIRENMEQSLSGILREISRIFDFYNSMHHKNIERIYIVGGTSQLYGLKEFMENFFKIPTDVPVDNDHIYFLPVFGCILRGE